MYQVIQMYGDNEPWWFFENWKEDIIEEQNFTDFEEAKVYFEETWLALRESYHYIQDKPNYLAAFWNEGDDRWCEECDDDLQQYMGLALTHNYQPLTIESRKELYETADFSRKTKCCTRLKQGVGR